MKNPQYNFSIGGGELFDRVIEDEFVLTEKACIAFMKQILEGVAYMHSEQVIHLDLKVGINPSLIHGFTTSTFIFFVYFWK